MGVTKRIVCFANSRKLQGRCIAGKEWVNQKVGSWVRPVSNRKHQEVSERERHYENGNDPHVLDVIDIPLLKPLPKDYQHENWLLDPNKYWKKVTSINVKDIPLFLDSTEELWIDGYSTRNGKNDKIPLSQAKELTGSLRLLKVERLRLKVFNYYNKQRVQGIFQYAEEEYRLWVTDPIYEEEYLEKGNGFYELGKTFLTISLGEPYEDDCYKLIATIIQLNV